jgi:hypothetical protein
VIDNPALFTLAEKICRENESYIISLEKRRRGHLWFMIIAAFILAGVAAPILWFFVPLHLRLPEPPFEMRFALVIAYVTFLFLLFPIFDADYRRKAKGEFLPLMARATGLEFRHNGFIRLGDIYEHHILPPYTVREVEEGFRGRHRNFDIEFQDFKISPVRDGFFFDWRSLLAFKPLRGVIIRVGLNKSLKYHTVLMPSFMANGFLKRVMHEKFTFHKSVKFAYRRFLRDYTIMATHEIEAHYVFDPAVIERVMALGELLKADWLEISFKDREMVFYAQYAANFFEIGGLLRPVNVLTVERGLAEIHALKSILDILELTPHAGLGATVPVNKNLGW